MSNKLPMTSHSILRHYQAAQMCQTYRQTMLTSVTSYNSQHCSC